MSKIHITPYMAGAKAFNEGKGFWDNPYASPHQRKQFAKGWEFAKSERALKEIQKKSGWK